MPSWLELLEGEVDAAVMTEARREELEGRRADDFLLEKHLVTAPVILSALSRHFMYPSIEVEHYHPEEKWVSMISEEIVRRYSLLPLFDEDNRLYVAMINPDDLYAQDYVKQLTGLLVEPVITTHQSLINAINRLYLSKEKSAEAMEGYVEKKDEAAVLADMEVRFGDEEAPAIKLVNYIISQGVNLEASDIHIEPLPNRVSLRYRIDGILHEFPPPPLHIFRALISRIKILSNLDVAERRLPQDGRTSVDIEGRRYDMRISIIPNVRGEGVVIRILDTQGMGKELVDLGFAPEMRTLYEKLIRRPYGIILVTGPTGSGKSTTLYATLKHIYSPQKKIITIEDPVEYQINEITQIQINPEIEYTFALGLRSILRHDPDIIMLGEIRDLESAEIAMRASLTGHFVFSTLHTNDAPSALTRLLDMGLPAYLVFSTLIAVVAQRLVRVLCPKCKEKHEPDPIFLEALGISSLPPDAQMFRPVGCTYCNNIGYKGRTAIYELLEVTQEMRRLTGDSINPDNIKRIAHDKGFVSLRDSAIGKLFAGVTSRDEVLSITAQD
jgi:type II secretory ATPase GspE/PulE/Tfp pilus assembly ATPase PilB-like protein